ncbi:MAG: single-stranded DNA-binding protein [Spirochaetia bacterium]
MADINVVVLVGRLVRDAELKYTSSGYPVCKFSIAINRRRKQGDQWVDEANFFDINLWGKRAEALAQYLTKGTQVGIQGELRQNKWEQDGQPRSKIEITANDIQLLGGGRGGQSQSAQSGGDNQRPSYGPQDFNSQDNFEDDIPF